MKHSFLKGLIAFFFFLGSFGFTSAAGIDHFELTVSPETVNVGEAIDLTIEAVDKNNATVKDYEGTILIFSESDKNAEFPNSLEDNSYTFKKSDEGKVKFENAIKFKTKGKNDIHVYDLSDETDSIMGLAEVEVVEKEDVQNIDIEILSPENGITIGEKEITVSGTTQKNHQIKILLNNKTEFLTTSDKEGVFEKKITDLPDGESVIKAYVLDADDKEVGTSKEIHISSELGKPTFNKAQLDPSTPVEAQKEVMLTVYATKGLTEVTALLNDALYPLKEDTEGVYKGSFLSPKETGNYDIEISLKDELGHTTKQSKAVTLTVKEPELTAAPQKKDECKEGDYSGNVFDGQCGEKPADYNAPIDLGIKNLKVVQLKTKSILTWDKLEDAEKYEVYKKMEGGELELIETVTEPKYEINITGDAVKYDYFAVKAIGKQEFVDTEDETKKIEKEVQGDISEAVKIQTGPEALIIFSLALLLGLGIFFINRRQQL